MNSGCKLLKTQFLYFPMGKIKTKLIKRTSEKLLEEDIDFSEDFEENKNILHGVSPSKKVRNQIAGYITRLNKQKAKNKI